MALSKIVEDKVLDSDYVATNCRFNCLNFASTGK